MTWWGEWLILLPQYPAQYGTQQDGAIFMLPKAEILAFLDGTLAGPLTPLPLPVRDGGIAQAVPGFEGFEAIAVVGERVFLTIEASPGNEMMGYLLAGTLSHDPSALTLEPSTLVEIPPQAALGNMSDESVLVTGETLLTLYEANGAAVNPAPVAHRFSLTLEPLASLPLAPIEYRLTDATPADEQGRFWAINVFWPGDLGKLRPQPDPLVTRFGEGSSHQRWMTVERLVEFQIGEAGIAPTDTPPLQLALVDDLNSRNWEGIARLDERGFLLVTDSFPSTLLAFVEGAN